MLKVTPSDAPGQSPPGWCRSPPCGGGGIVYLADAVGTQTETLVVRGLSLGMSVRQMLRREVWTGLLVGLVLGGLVLPPVVAWRWGDVQVAAAVALSLFAACSTATVVAILLPWALDHLGRDPAFGSGPLAAVVQDLLSILIYFGVASVVVG